MRSYRSVGPCSDQGSTIYPRKVQTPQEKGNMRCIHDCGNIKGSVNYCRWYEKECKKPGNQAECVQYIPEKGKW